MIPECFGERVLIWAVGRDGPLTCAFLESVGHACLVCRDVETLCEQTEVGAGALVVAAELLTGDARAYLRAALGRQPAWSDLPVLVVAGATLEPAATDALIADLGNVTLLPRPLALETLRSAVRASLRSRRRQYEIQRLMEQRDEADRRKDEFLAMLAHELRNPLAPLRSAAEVMRLRAAGDPVFSSLGEVVGRQVTQMARLVDDLLDVARITRGKITLRKEVLDVGEALTRIAGDLRPLAHDRGLSLDVEVPATPLRVEADRTRFDQMVGNALSNALKFTPPGGRITLAAACEDRRAVVRVRDTGVGISPKMIAQVFELFAQTERPLDRSQGGLGIGLTVLRSLARMHGGDVRLSSEGDGRGTEVTIDLPAFEEATGADAGRSSPEARPGCRILVVDDNVDAALCLSLLLSAHGHDVVTAHDGPQALEAARTRPPDVAICDIGLPGMSGYDLVRNLRDLLGERCLYVAVTGYGGARDRQRALEAGFDRHFAKPVESSTLLSVVAEGGC